MRELNFNLDYIEDISTKLKIKHIIDKVRMVLKNHSVESTEFLDPYEIRLSKSILDQISEVSYIEYGGLEEAERRILCIFPEYMEFNEENSKIGCIEVDRFDGLTHRDYLGSILGLGITREKIGDILLYKDIAIFIVKKEVVNYILMNLNQIGNSFISIKETDIESIEPPIDDYEEFQIYTSSLRLDTIISHIYSISRSESLRKIKSNNVKINWEHITKPTKILNEGDTISLKGFGRSKIVFFKGESRKGKSILKVRKLK